MANGDENFFVVKVDSLGDTLWTKEYDAGGQERILDLFQTSDMGLVMIGTWEGWNPAYMQCVYVVRTDSNGSVIWSKLYSGTSYTMCRAGLLTSDGYILACGMADSTSILDEKPFLMKIDPNGSLVWMNRYNPGQYPMFYFLDCIVESADGNYVCGGYAPNNGINAFVLVSDTTGSCLWAALLGGQGNIGVSDMVVTPTGDIMISGSWSSSQFGFYVMTLDAACVVQWMNVYVDSVAVPNNSGIFLDNGEIIVTGAKSVFPSTGYTAKLSSTGNVMYSYMNDTTGVNMFTDCLSLQNGGNVLLGQYWGAHSPVDSGSFFLVRTRADGTTNCGDVPMSLTSFAVVPTDTFFAASHVSGGIEIPVSTTTSSGSSVIQLCGTSTEEYESIGYLNIYPNPANDFLVIEFSETTNGQINLYNCNGEFVKTEQLNSERAIISLEGLAPGIYFFRIVQAAEVIGTGNVVKE